MRVLISIALVLATAFVLGCIGQGPEQPGPGAAGMVYFTITDKALDMANVSSVAVTINSIEVHKTAAEALQCRLSLCDCRCYIQGQRPEELNGTLCGINCLGEFNVSGCKVVDNECKETLVNETSENESEQSEAANESEGEWITVLNESKTYDLLALTGVEELIGSADLEAGEYNIIRLYISNVTVTIGNETETAKLPSGKIQMNVHFEVTENGSSIVKFDFDLNESLHITGAGQVIMAPVIKVSVDKEAELQIQNRIVNRIRTETETEAEIGMDENGTTGEGKKIGHDQELEIGDDGKVKVREREETEAQTHDVNVRVSGFSPSILTINAGDTVRWIFRDVFAHRVVSESAGFDSGSRYQEETWSFTFDTAGTFSYHDEQYPTITGTITVQ